MNTQTSISLCAVLLSALLGPAGCTTHGTKPTLAAATKDLAPASTVTQLSFDTPEDAVAALLNLAQTGDKEYGRQIFGPEVTELSSDDPARDTFEREMFSRALQLRHELRANPDGTRTIIIGEHNAEFPVPLIQVNGRWMFDTVAGVERLDEMRVGYNELKTIEFLRALPAAQQEYFASTHDGSTTHEYARRLRSSQGKHDGLYWPATGPEDASPLGPYAAAGDGYYSESSGYNGYFYSLITSQGPSAPTGAKSFEVNGQLVNGWAALAYPSQYGVTGFKSFIVSQDGIVYEQDLGDETPDAAKIVTVFDPANGWTEVGK